MSESSPDHTLSHAADELSAIAHRLAALSSTLRAHAAAQTAREPQITPGPQGPLPPPQQPPQSAPPPRAGTRETWAASRVLAWAGGSVTLLGVVFLLVLAVQRGWLSPPLRVGAGVVLAALLITSGWWTHRGPGRAGGYALAATGFATLYLDVVAATSLYGYLPVPAGLGFGLLVAVGGLLLADRWRAQPLAIGAVLGCAVCSPMITQRPDALLIGFLVLLQIAAAPVQLRHGWRGLTVAAAIPAVVAGLVADVWALQLPSDDTAVVAAVIAVALFGVALSGITAWARPRDDATTIGVLVASPVPALLATPLLDRTSAGFVVTGVAATLLAVWGVGRFIPAFRELLPPRYVVAAGGAGAIAAVQATMTFVDPSAWATALLCEALLLTLGARQLRSGAVLVGAVGYAAAGFVMAQFHEVPPTVLLALSPATGTPGVLVGLLIAGAAAAVPVVGVRLGALPRLPAARGLWILAGILALYGTASATMALVLLVREDQTGFFTGHVLITLSWVLAAIVLLLRGVRAPSLRVAGMVLLPVSLAKLSLFDLATLDGFARVVVFLCAGLVLLAAGVRYTRLVSTADQNMSRSEG